MGDIAVPGLLACLALRFDSSKMRNLGGMNASAQAAASAFEDSFNPSKVITPPSPLSPASAYNLALWWRRYVPPYKCGSLSFTVVVGSLARLPRVNASQQEAPH